MLERRPEEVIRLAVKGMLPRNRLARKQLTKLKVYAGPEHPHAAQQPQPLEIETLMADETPQDPQDEHETPTPRAGAEAQAAEAEPPPSAAAEEAAAAEEPARRGGPLPRPPTPSRAEAAADEAEEDAEDARTPLRA